MTLIPRTALTFLPLAALFMAPAVAFAQDADGDGVPNAADVYPCDGARAAVSYHPAQGASALLVFEDQWPGDTDLDYNDVAVRVHTRAERNGAGQVVQLHAVFDPVAVGGEYSNGLALQLPVARAGVTVRRRIAGGAWSTVALQADAQATMILSEDLRELYGDAPGRINSLPELDRVQGDRLEVEISFATPAALSASTAPWDVFVFRSGDFSHQIHFPQYAGTAAMNTALFNTAEDGSTASRHFVHVSGVPAALDLMTTEFYPQEAIDIASLFPNIVGFASSGGTTHQDFYVRDVVSSAGFGVAAPALTDSAPSLECMGTLGVASSALSFAALPTVASDTRTVVLTNSGPAPLTITSRTLTGAAAARYTLGTGCAVGTVLASGGGTCTLAVTFTAVGGDASAAQQATLTIGHGGRNAAQTIALTGNASFTPATPMGASGATPPVFSGNTVTWASSGASHGGFTVGTSMRNAGRFAMTFQGTAASLNALEYNIQTTVGGTYYGPSFITGRIVRSGGDLLSGSANGATFSRPTLANNDRILITLDYANRNVAWYHCPASTGVCNAAPFHSVTGIIAAGATMRVYSYKTQTGAVSVTLGTSNITGMPAAAATFHNGVPQ